MVPAMTKPRPAACHRWSRYQGRGRQKRDPDVAGDDEGAPGEGFGAGGDLFPVVVPIDQAGTDQDHRREDENESDDAEQNLLHALCSVIDGMKRNTI